MKRDAMSATDYYFTAHRVTSAPFFLILFLSRQCLISTPFIPSSLSALLRTPGLRFGDSVTDLSFFPKYFPTCYNIGMKRRNRSQLYLQCGANVRPGLIWSRRVCSPNSISIDSVTFADSSSSYLRIVYACILLI